MEIISRTRQEPDRNPVSESESVAFLASSSPEVGIPPLSALHLPPFPLNCISFPQPLLPTLNTKPETSIISIGPCGDPYCLGYHSATPLKSPLPLLYHSLPLPPSSMSAFTIFPHSFIPPHDLHSGGFHSVTAHSSETSLSVSAGSHTHAAPSLRNPHHTLGPGSRYHPYLKTPFPTTSNSYYSLHGLTLYGPRLHPAP